jgi:GAF domain-containing protein/FHA domain-containing protein
MPAKLTLHPPERASRFLILRDGETLIVGREPESGLVLEDRRVSKRHARLQWNGSGWRLEDLGSKNGTIVNGIEASGALLAAGDWISFGGVMGRFETLSEAEVSSLDLDRLARLNTSVEMRRRLGADLEPFDFLLRFLQSAMEVTGAERGLVLLVGPQGALRAEVAAGFASDHLAGDRFAGSVGAIQRVLKTKASVVVSDAQADPFLGKRPSVVGMGLGALACVPIRQDDEVLGVIYVDSRERATGFAQLDLEVLEALAEHAAIVIASLRLDRRMQKLFRPTILHGGDPALLAELQQRIAEFAAGSAAAPADERRAI